MIRKRKSPPADQRRKHLLYRLNQPAPGTYDPLRIDDRLSEQFISPPYLRHQPDGQLPPEYGKNLVYLRAVESDRKLSDDQARYYETTQMETDKMTAKHLYILDGVLRQDALLREDPLPPNPNP